MPRNASGTYSLPSGNPVSSGTLIDATWANNTLNDIANEMTDSLSRSGEGGMLAPFRLNDGVQATPGLAFTNEPSTGMYRAGTNEAWLVAGGTQVLQFTTNGAAARFAAGAVGTPSITALGDLNTGLWFPAADTLAASTGGSERLRVDSSGNVGIGTASPVVRLDVSTSAGSTPSYSLNALTVRSTATAGVGVGPSLMFSGKTNNSTADYSFASIQGVKASAAAGDYSGSLLFYLQNSGGSALLDEQMRLTATGLGIGTASPAYKLDVRGVTASGNGTITTGFTYDTRGLVGTFSNHALGFITNGASPSMLLDTSGNLGIGTASPGQRLTVQGPSNQAFLLTQDSTGAFQGIYGADSAIGGAVLGSLSNHPAIFRTNNTERMRITSAGNIVAGASAALATTATDGFLYVPTCAGTPTGTPTAITGMAPIVVDTTNNRWYFYSGGAWRNAGP